MSGADPGFVLALDQGGHASRAVAFDGFGRELASAHVPVATTRDGTDVVEQDPLELVRSLQVAAQDACEADSIRSLPAISAGLATQRSTIVCWERSSGRALTSAISWQDRRNAAWLGRLHPVAAAIRAKTGLVLSPHYGASKLRWCLDNVPAVQRAARANDLVAGPLASFLLSRLLEEAPLLADPANASRTLLFDPETLDWSQQLLDVFGVARDYLPRCVPTRHGYGHLPVGQRRIALAACTGDQSAAAFAFGPPRESVALVNVGTGAFVQRVAPTGVRLPDGLLQSVLRSDGSGAIRSHEGTVNGAGSAIEWLSGRVALDIERALPGLAAPTGAAMPLFMNGVGGLGAPFWKPDFPVEFIGSGDDLQLLASVVESIAFLLSENLAAMRSVAALERIVISGGLARCSYLCQSLADLNGLVVERYALQEATARGIAFLAAGEPADWLAPDIERSFAPAANRSLAARHARWRSEMAQRGAVV
jgi:glycerol kinase